MAGITRKATAKVTFEASSIGKTRSAFCPAACKYLATVPVRHSLPEPMLLLSVELLGLIRSQHTKTLLSRFFPCENSLYLTPGAPVNTHFSGIFRLKKIFFHFFGEKLSSAGQQIADLGERMEGLLKVLCQNRTSFVQKQRGKKI
jgi:hypothetical protein